MRTHARDQVNLYIPSQDLEYPTPVNRLIDTYAFPHAAPRGIVLSCFLTEIWTRSICILPTIPERI